MVSIQLHIVEAESINLVGALGSHILTYIIYHNLILILTKKNYIYHIRIFCVGGDCDLENFVSVLSMSMSQIKVST